MCFGEDFLTYPRLHSPISETHIAKLCIQHPLGVEQGGRWHRTTYFVLKACVLENSKENRVENNSLVYL